MYYLNYVNKLRESNMSCNCLQPCYLTFVFVKLKCPLLERKECIAFYDTISSGGRKKELFPKSAEKDLFRMSVQEGTISNEHVRRSYLK